jgi:acetylornithine deacetylase/succinyl-diaminopimelate desuccinylase-like protein
MGATVVSIETNHQRCEETKLVNGQEIGVKLDKKIKDGTLLMRLMPATDPNLLHQPNENMPLDNYEI